MLLPRPPAPAPGLPDVAAAPCPVVRLHRRHGLFDNSLVWVTVLNPKLWLISYSTANIQSGSLESAMVQCGQFPN